MYCSLLNYFVFFDFSLGLLSDTVVTKQGSPLMTLSHHLSQKLSYGKQLFSVHCAKKEKSCCLPGCNQTPNGLSGNVAKFANLSSLNFLFCHCIIGPIDVVG